MSAHINKYMKGIELLLAKTILFGNSYNPCKCYRGRINIRIFGSKNIENNGIIEYNIFTVKF